MAGPLDKLKARVALVRSQAANLRPAVEKVGQEWRKDRKRDFRTQGATTLHGRWQANKASTIRQKGHSRILQGRPRNGYQLMSSIIKRRHVDHVFEWVPGGRSIRLGTRDPKSRYHALGLGGLPIRRPVDPNTKDRLKYTRILTRWSLRGKL